jgi:hypothetical protein
MSHIKPEFLYYEIFRENSVTSTMKYGNLCLKLNSVLFGFSLRLSSVAGVSISKHCYETTLARQQLTMGTQWSPLEMFQ